MSKETQLSQATKAYQITCVKLKEMLLLRLTVDLKPAVSNVEERNRFPFIAFPLPGT